MNQIDPLNSIDVRSIAKSPLPDYVRDNPQVRAYLLAPATYYEYAWEGGETDLTTLKLLNMADVVSLEAKQCLASGQPDWLELDESLHRFLDFNESAARQLIAALLNKLQKAILDSQWYELMEAYQQLRQHVDHILFNHNQLPQKP